MKLAIADPPYLGRGNRWYGSGCGHGHGRGRAANHPEARLWDDPATHRALVSRLEATYDGWAVAASVDSLSVYLPVCPPHVRILSWHKGNSIPSGSRVANQWEAVLARVPDSRRGHTTAAATSDVLTAGVTHRHSFVGSKPPAWTHWVLTVLGYAPDDELHDLFTGSGAVALAASLYAPPSQHQCAVCGRSIIQPLRGRRRRTCSDSCRARLSRRTAP